MKINCITTNILGHENFRPKPDFLCQEAKTQPQTEQDNDPKCTEPTQYPSQSPDMNLIKTCGERAIQPTDIQELANQFFIIMLDLVRWLSGGGFTKWWMCH